MSPQTTTTMMIIIVCSPASMVAPTHQPVTDGHCGSPNSYFLTLNWSEMYSWRSWRELFGGSWNRRWGHPGLVRQKGRRMREGYEGSLCVCLRDTMCVYMLLSIFSAFCEGARWGPFTPQWVFRLPAVTACYLLSPFLLTSLPLLFSLHFLFCHSFDLFVRPPVNRRLLFQHSPSSAFQDSCLFFRPRQPFQLIRRPALYLILRRLSLCLLFCP